MLYFAVQRVVGGKTDVLTDEIMFTSTQTSEQRLAKMRYLLLVKMGGEQLLPTLITPELNITDLTNPDIILAG